MFFTQFLSLGPAVRHVTCAAKRSLPERESITTSIIISPPTLLVDEVRSYSESTGCGVERGDRAERDGS